MKKNSPIKQIPRWLFPVLITVFVFLIYGNSIKNEYALDDNYVTVTNLKEPGNSRVAKGIKGIPEIFSSHYVESSSQSFEYRPLVLATFAIEYQFFGSNPHVSHFISVLIYALTCLLLFSILCKLLKNYNIVFPLLIIFLFIAHPIHTEVVSNIKCRDELLSFLFGICSLHFFLKSMEVKNKWLPVVLAIVFLLMALLCKRTSVLFMVLIPLTIYFFNSIKLKQIVIISVLPLIAFLFYRILTRVLIHSLPVIRDFAFFENPLYYEHSFLARISMIFYSMGYYIKLLVFPYPLSCYYGYNTIPMVGLGSPIVIVSAVFYFAIGIYALIKLPQKSIFSYSIIVFLIGIFPFANMVTPVVGIVGERFIYFASFGFCMAAAYMLLIAFKVDYKNSKTKLKIIKPSFKRSVLVVLIIFSALTISRNNKWKDSLTLFRNDAGHFENSYMLHYLIGKTLSSQLADMPAGYKKDELMKETQTHFNQAAELLRTGLEKYKTDYLTMTTLGTIYNNSLNDVEAALPYFKKSLSIDPDYDVARYNLAFCYEKKNLPDSAILFYEKMVEAKTAYPPVYLQLHELYLKKQDYPKAIVSDEKAVKQCPAEYSVKAYVNLGNALMLNKDTLNAIKQFEKAVELEPKFTNLRAQVVAFLKSVRYTEKAKKLNQK